MCSGLQGDETPRYLRKCLLHRFRCRRYFLFQNDLARFIQNTVERLAHAQKVQLISKSNRKDDRHDARTLARLVRIDPELLGPVRHRRAQAQIHLTVIRARAELVRARERVGNR